MTRLINADDIPWFVEGVGDIPVVTKDEIDRMPTVDAVPISFIKGLIDLSRKVGADHHAESLEILLADWAERKEE